MNNALGRTVTVSAFDSVPDFARGIVRDVRVRWACEEIDQPYITHLLVARTPRPAQYLKVQPFGQVPALWDDNIQMFESGAILLHLAERDERLLPSEPATRARAISWILAALNTIEPPLTFLSILDFFVGEVDLAKQARPSIAGFARQRLQQLSAYLGDKDWLEAQFTVADLLMVCVLRSIRHTGLVREFPNLSAYQSRGESRPAFARALESHLQEVSAA